MARLKPISLRHSFYADNYTWTEQYIRKKQVEYINNVFEMIYFTYLKIIG